MPVSLPPGVYREQFACLAWTIADPFYQRIYPLSCDRWDCPRCRLNKIARLQKAVRLSSPTATCTIANIAPQGDLNPKTISKAIHAINQAIRRAYGEWEYWGSAEATRAQSPHLHLAARAPFIPQKELLSCVQHAARNPHAGVRIESIRSQPALAAYIAKHCPSEHSGQRKIGRKRIRCSANFYSPEARRLLQPRITGCTVLPAGSDQVRAWIQREGPHAWTLLREGVY